MAKEDMDESTNSQMFSKLKKNPFLTVGFASFLITAGVGIYKFKSRPKNMNAGSYLVQLRVMAQAMVVGSLTMGVVVGLLDRYVLNKKTN